MKFTRIPESAFKELVLNAGYLATTFDPAAGTAPEESALLGATTGGMVSRAFLSSMQVM